jgi:LSD1 subclass zinc finger protein
MFWGERERMPAQLMCPNIKCRRILIVPDEARGKVVKCSHCQTALRVPAPKPAAPEPTKK